MHQHLCSVASHRHRSHPPSRPHATLQSGGFYHLALPPDSQAGIDSQVTRPTDIRITDK